MVNRRETETARELRFEGWGLLVVVTVLIAAGAGAFYTGRIYERRVGPPPAHVAAPELDPLGEVVDAGDAPLADVESTTDHFDAPAGDGAPAEPSRELARSAPEEAAEGRADAPAAEAGAGFFVQVFAGRDRQAAEKMVERVRGDDFRVRLFAQSEGQGSLFKVQVGGYATREEAMVAAGELQKKGYNGAWVTGGG